MKIGDFRSCKSILLVERERILIIIINLFMTVFLIVRNMLHTADFDNIHYCSKVSACLNIFANNFIYKIWNYDIYSFFLFSIRSIKL